MISWVTTAATLLAVWLTGRNLRLSWKVSLLNQAIWLVFIITYEAWGLLPLTLALSGIFARHLWRTRDSDRSWTPAISLAASATSAEPTWCSVPAPGRASPTMPMVDVGRWPMSAASARTGPGKRPSVWSRREEAS